MLTPHMNTQENHWKTHATHEYTWKQQKNARRTWTHKKVTEKIASHMSCTRAIHSEIAFHRQRCQTSSTVTSMCGSVQTLHSSLKTAQKVWHDSFEYCLYKHHMSVSIVSHHNEVAGWPSIWDVIIDAMCNCYHMNN